MGRTDETDGPVSLRNATKGTEDVVARVMARPPMQRAGALATTVGQSSRFSVIRNSVARAWLPVTGNDTPSIN